MFYLALDGDRHSLEPFVRMCFNTAAGVGRWKFVRRDVIEQEKWTQFLPEAVIIEHGPDRKTIADPMRARTLINVK